MKDVASTKKIYVPPTAVVVEIQIERGFAGSGQGVTESFGHKDGEW